MKIKKYLSTKTLGYSKDFKTTYDQHEILFDDGIVRTRYSYTITNQEGMALTGPLLEYRPYVEREINEDT